MEEEKYTVYDLESSDGAQIPEMPEQESLADNESSADAELTRMIADMGAEKALEILKGNRNSAIEQILSELESGSDRTLQSGNSVAASCQSIFDLAALA